MECKDCKYYKVDSFTFNGKKYTNRMCEITHLCNTKSCNAESYEHIENANICFNCKYWHGGGDWGLSCEKNYYNCSANGFDEVCEQFERKQYERNF